MMNQNAAIKCYLDLMKNVLTYYLWGETERPFVVPASPGLKNVFYKTIKAFLARRGIKMVREVEFDREARKEGRDWPLKADTMIGLERLNNIQYCIEEIILNNIPGDVIETGVWRGGATIFMRACLKAHEVTDRKVWVADSFEGLPMPNEERYPVDKDDNLHSYDFLRVSLESVKENFNRYGLLDEQVRFLKGWFKDTLPTAPIEKLSLMRLDGDMYESTMDSLSNLYPKLSMGGYVIIDDYNLKTCVAAVTDFRQNNNITSPLIKADWAGVYWKKM
jgi:O-methyltransferase